MIRRLGVAHSSPPGSLAAVLERAVADGSPEPLWAAVEDPDAAWLRAVAGVPAAERARGIVAVWSEAALVAASRLGVGGALWLPPSLAGAVDALQAAATPEAGGFPPDMNLVDFVAPGNKDLVAVSWVHRSFWRSRVGEVEMATVLAALAEALGVLPVVLPWPALIAQAGPTAAEIEGAWRRITWERQVQSEGVEIVPVERLQGEHDVAASAMRSLLARGERAQDPSAWGFPRPVHELPSGRRVGWWSPRDVDAAVGGDEWTAVPVEPSPTGFRWRLREGDGSERVVVDELWTATSSGGVIRVPGRIAGGVAAGRPAGLLLERLAAVAQRLGVPLWVPNLRPGSLRFVLRLPGTLWVDGAAVPDGD